MFRFCRLFPDAPDIVKADGSALGTIPARALQYCEGLTAAARQGWYVFPPVSFDLMWTGSEVVFRIGEDDWTILDRYYLAEAVTSYVKIAPEEVHDCYPSFLDLFSEGNIVQIWTGYAIHGQEGICHHVRGPINMPLSGHYQYFEAILDSSWFLSPLATNIRLTKQDVPISFPTHRPLLQIVPLPTSVLAKSEVTGSTVELDVLDHEFWSTWETCFRDRNKGEMGSYARKQRRISKTY
ncbi:DUF6065 family protein (plasmid) [Nitratireductor sp. GISD-1A_MAKvit]|uniref:DUF6065 family protein n=1 Tax=Nitratireductor sp. GISD-1A_MAKvit TaxID=3234198 RepID=UPI003466B2E3